MVLRRSARSPGRTGAAGRDTAPAGQTDLVRTFVDEVTWYMTEHKVSRAGLAQAMGVSPGRVSQILSGEDNLTLRTLSMVVDALGAEFDISLRPADDSARYAADLG